ncbi:MAG: radical SAM protein [Acidobacteriaceae bacterium]
MAVHLINPSDLSFGTGVITPRWLFVLAGATPAEFGDPILVDETLEQLDPATIQPGDIVGIGIHTGNTLRGYAIGKLARERGAWVVFGGIHATLFPSEVRELGAAHAVVQGDGDVIWAKVLQDCRNGAPLPVYAAGRIDAADFKRARWDLMPKGKYMWASVQTIRGCPKHCSFCSVWRTDGQKPRVRHADQVIAEIIDLRRLGFRFMVLADDNFYPVSLKDLQLAERQGNQARLQELKATRAERFELMEKMSALPKDMVFFTQITMEAAEDTDFLDAMSRAYIRGALVGIEAVTPQGLKDVYKDFNLAGEELVNRLKTFREHNVHVLGSFIFGLPSDRPETFDATLDVASRADISFAQFVLLQPLPGTIDFGKWEKSLEANPTRIGGVPLTRYWLIPHALRPKIYNPHPVMSATEIGQRTQKVWDAFYSLKYIWPRAHCVKSLKGRLAFVLISKLYRQMYANTGIATDSARVNKSARWARWLAAPTRLLFAARPMPELQMPITES